MAVFGVTLPPSQQDPDQGAGTLKRTIRKLLQTSNPTPPTPFSPLKLTENGKTCILFWAKKLIVKLRNHTHVDLTDRAFSPNARVDLKGSSCNGEKAIFLLSNTYYESTAQSWFSLDSVHILYNRTKEANFNATQIYAPAVSSYHCQHVSSLHKYDTLLEPSSHGDNSLLWHITFIDIQIQAFNVEGGWFSPASDCASFFTPAVLMGLLMSLILLLVLAYALHMVLHLKSIEQLDEHRPSVYLESEAESEPGDKEQAGQ
ncbi:V-type proton ATPase subunit S1 [Acipenser ruthenus]|uniref:V-type proton ATPase subunit S1 n=1 Tax=Acipenser ruthenus TaxID=7906 RepID=A0A662YK10_ACIRT|nr:V-type proton ATPase subunit S1 [Acipenser ruthenus]